MNKTDAPIGDSVLARLEHSLRSAGISFTQTQHRPVYTSAEAAEVRGASLHSGAKALIVKGGVNFLMVVIPADLSLDSHALRSLLGTKKLRFATKEEVLERTGLTPGSIPPFGSLFNLPTYCDERLADNERINFNAGSHSASIQMSYADYVAFESPRIAKVAMGMSNVE
ncbi:MAG: YbaK/EbsC family protein [Chloroflexota bacterium]